MKHIMKCKKFRYKDYGLGGFWCEYYSENGIKQQYYSWSFEEKEKNVFITDEFIFLNEIESSEFMNSIKTKLTSHNKYNSKLLLNKKYWKELGFKDNDKISIIKLEDGKVLIEKIGDDENV